MEHSINDYDRTIKAGRAMSKMKADYEPHYKIHLQFPTKAER